MINEPKKGSQEPEKEENLVIEFFTDDVYDHDALYGIIGEAQASASTQREQTK